MMSLSGRPVLLNSCLPQLYGSLTVHTLFLISRSHTSAISLQHVAAGGGGGKASVAEDLY